MVRFPGPLFTIRVLAAILSLAIGPLQDTLKMIDHQLTALLREFFHQDSFDFSPGTSLKDVPGWDSIAHVNLMKALETEFGIRFTVRDMVKMTTIDGIKQVLEARLLNTRPS